MKRRINHDPHPLVPVLTQLARSGLVADAKSEKLLTEKTSTPLGEGPPAHLAARYGAFALAPYGA